ncbi:MAG TPA: asparagine synthase (glutamine-hydrolyzing) [Anaerolineales bacterium]|nr:asparagine synthase (glutamine-hydrolyzing) [Anaerolineales bacterium]
MCGITGILKSNPADPVDRGLLEKMNRCIIHRGPDSDGFHFDGPVGLGVRRLAIVDLVSGDQPIANEAGTVWIVFNGEIFNFPDLRPALEGLGHVFRTHSDTEAIVHLYEEYGPACVNHLRGQFAFAIWDSVKGRLFLARDRLGQKPLYYAVHDGAFYFGSELKTILQVPGIPREPNLEALHHYLTLMYVPDPDTAFVGIHKLPPGNRLSIRPGGEPEIERYWDLDYEPKWDLPEADLRAELREEITKAVRIRLMSDVPLGAHLSGGIDSTIVVGLMAGMMDQPVKTFSIGFAEARYSETAEARQVAEMYATEHREFILEPDVMGVLTDMARHFDEPFADPAALPTWHLAQMTREHVTVALNGDGGDEAFAGYQRYFADPYVDLYRLVPGSLRRGVLDPLIRRLPVQADRPMERSYTAALRGLARGATVPHAASKVRWSTYFQEDEKWALYNDEMKAALNGAGTSADQNAEAFRNARARHRIDRTLYTDIHHYLPGALLPKVDRMTMAHSLEARSPFLDHKVMELAARLPVHWKVRGRTTKWILRDLFRDLMPPGFEKRPKSGFSVPLGPWLRGDLYEPARELLLAGGSRVHAYLRPDGIERLLRENREGRDNHGKRIWALLNLELWMRTYL